MPEAVSSLMTVLRSDASPEVRSAIAAALGESHLAPGTRLELVDLLRNPKAAGKEEMMEEDGDAEG